MKLLRRIRYLLNRGRLERELRDEMSAHRAMLATDRKTSFGSDLRLREESRDAWGWNWLDQLRQDLAYGTRQLRRAPGFTFTVVSILALGAGLNLAAFHIFNATYHSRISLRDADSLLRFVRQSRSSRSNTFPYGAIAFYRDNSTVFSYVVTETSAGGVLAEDGPARSTFVSETYFPDLGVVPALGRLLDVRDSQPNAPPSVVLGYRFWQNKYGGDSEIAGKKIRLNDKSVEIVGVAPANFDGLAPRGTALWFPMTARPYLIEGGYGPADLSRADTAMYAKLKPGVPVAQAEAQLGLLTVELRNRSSITLEGEDVVRGESLLSARADLGRGRPVALLASLVFLILLSACANLGNVLLARGLARQRELQTRVAVGAGRWRVIRQLMTENLLLSALGCAAALIVGYFAAKLFLYFSEDLPPDLQISMDWRTVLVAAALAVFSALVFGLAPALQSVRTDARGTHSRQILIALQVSVCCVLLILSGLLARSAQRLSTPQIRFDYAHMTGVRTGLSSRNLTPVAIQQQLDEAKARIEQLPGVDGVTFAARFPFSDWSIYTPRGLPPLFTNYVAPSYFEVMNLPFLRGRTFLPGEDNAVIVSESAARTIWPGEDALGKSLSFGSGPARNIVGVVKDSGASSVQDMTAVETYWPLNGRPLGQAVLIVHSLGGPGARSQDIRAAVLQPGLFPEIVPLKSAMDRRVTQVLSLTKTIGALGASAALLAAVGIFGLVAFAVVQRNREIGLRMALGARPIDIVQTLTGHYALPVGVGTAAGVALAATLGRLLNRAFFGLNPLEPAGYLAGLAIFAAVALAAILIPARRALRIDPASALRWE